MIFMVRNSFGEPQCYLSRLCSDVHTLQRDLHPSSDDFVIFHSNFQRKYYSKVQRTLSNSPSRKYSCLKFFISFEN